MPEEDEEETRKIAQKSTDKKVLEPGSVDACKSSAPAGPVPVPYPNIEQASDTSSGSERTKISGKERVTEKSSYLKSTGDEAGESNGKSLTHVLKKANAYKIFGVPVWILVVGLIILLVVLYLLTPSTLQPTGPIDEPIA